MSGQVVVDASVVVKWLVWEDDSDTALDLMHEWESGNVRMLAPPMLMNETANALLRKERDGKIRAGEARVLMREFGEIGIEFVEWPDLYDEGIALALALNHPAVYDTLYLAVAEEYGCELWLADGPFYDRAVAAGRPVRFLGDAP